MDGLDYIDPQGVSDERRPSGRQIYKVAQVALAALGRSWPQTARDATELINELQLEPIIRALGEHPEAWAHTG
jgi:hypothetical protein